MSRAEKPVGKPQALTRDGTTQSPPPFSGVFLPPVSHDSSSEIYPSTPPAQFLPSQPRTPRPIRFVSPPRTPVPQLFTNPPTRNHSFKESESNGQGAESIPRPQSACSNYSSSSDSSFDSLTTFTTTGGSCASLEPETSFIADNPTKGSLEDISDEFTTSNTRQVEIGTSLAPKPNLQSGTRKVHWTANMDGHLWRTYIVCKQDPLITPFFVLPGQVPPLGVCHRVAREAKRSWKEARIGDVLKGPPNTARSRQRRFVTPTNELKLGGNKADICRKSSLYCWPASESSTRRRLRELCRRSYGSCNPHYNYHQQRRPASMANNSPSTSSTVSPSPYKSASSDRPTSRNASPFSTRGIALSLTTSTASTMKPTGVLAAIAAGHDIDSSMAVKIRASGVNSNGAPTRTSGAKCHERDILGAQSLAGSTLRTVNAVSRTTQDDTARPKTLGSSRATASVITPNGPVLLPPLDFKSFSSAYGTWPRRQKRQEEQESGDESTILPPMRRARRGTIGDLFAEPVPSPTAPSTRPRGFTIGSAFGSSINRRKFRQAAPLLTVTGPVSYDSLGDGESLSPLASRESRFDLYQRASEAPGHLGSPFAEPKNRKGNTPKAFDELSPKIGSD